MDLERIQEPLQVELLQIITVNFHLEDVRNFGRLATDVKELPFPVFFVPLIWKWNVLKLDSEGCVLQDGVEGTDQTKRLETSIMALGHCRIEVCRAEFQLIRRLQLLVPLFGKRIHLKTPKLHTFVFPTTKNLTSLLFTRRRSRSRTSKCLVLTRRAWTT